MNNTTVQTKGSVTACYAQGSKVEVWVSSPTGDSSDVFNYSIPCLSETQAEEVADMWRTAWDIPKY
jgi:hypothetical protein